MTDFWILVNEKIVLLLLVYGIVMGLIRRAFYRRLFYKSRSGFLLNALNFVGTPVHETGHFLFALLFGMQVTEVCFFKTLRQAKDGKLGYVNVRMKNGGFLRMFFNMIGSFFVGIGPLLIGPAVIIGAYNLLPDTIHSVTKSFHQPQALPGILQNFQFTDWILSALFLYLLIGISMNLELSHADLNMAWKGFFVIEILLVLLSAFLFYSNIPYIEIVNLLFSFLFTVSCVGVAGAVIGLLLSLLL